LFDDRAKIYVEAGKGGDGAVSFRREKFVPRGGPDGGDGGRGGDVLLIADPTLNTLSEFHQQVHYRAGSGGRGGRKQMHGKRGEDVRLRVPCGTLVRVSDTGDTLADLIEPGQTVVVAQGGRGGRGNMHFATPVRQVPRFAEKGEPGQALWLDLELKLIADVGLIGKPNAGKSTLLAAISDARPKIAAYPFTTLVPNLGVVEQADPPFVVADIPGLIEGASQGVGLGHDFLRHIERTRLLVHLLDGLSPDPLADYQQINTELRLYNPALVGRPQLVVVTKLDLTEVRQRWAGLRSALTRRGVKAQAISAVTGEGVSDLIRQMSQRLAEEKAKAVIPATLTPPPVLRPAPRRGATVIVREGKAWRVTGAQVERWTRITDWENPDAVDRWQHLLRRGGVKMALSKAGVHHGDTVRIGDREFTWNEATASLEIDV